MDLLRVEKYTGHHVESCHSPFGQGEIFMWLRFPKHDTTSQALRSVTTRVRHVYNTPFQHIVRCYFELYRFYAVCLRRTSEKNGKRGGGLFVHLIQLHLSYNGNSKWS
jgi:hypothetical protein